jgi:hypothetical protein
MNDHTEIIDREKEFWSGSVEYYDRWLARGALMVFPEPAGILRREEILAGIRSSHRWAWIEMSDISVARDNAAVVVAYRARARKPEAVADYIALVGSVYVRDVEGWKLAFHQHTPVEQR